MPPALRFRLSLAAKCRLLFGLAVILIIATALLVPWYYMERMVDELNVQKALHLATLARDHLLPTQPDWASQQRELDRWWSANAGTLELPPAVPRYIRLPQDEGHATPTQDPLLAEWLERFRDKSDLREMHTTRDAPDGHTIYRVALAVREPIDLQPKPALLGVVAVDFHSLESDAQIWPTRIVIMIAGALAGFLAVLVFYLITHKLILSPIRGLTEVVETVSSGDLNVRADMTTGDEFEVFAVAINDMLASLQRSQEELRTINRSLDTRLGELAETNVALFEANKLKSEFLANVSHELRTPLTSIIGFAELLRDAARTGDDQQRTRIARYAHNILTSGRSLLDLINDLLDLAKIEAGRMEIHRTHFNVRDVCEALIDFIRPIADKKNIALNVHLADDLPVMHSDAGKIQQVLYNLLSNAIKFTPDGGSVRLEAVRESDERVRVVVADTGPGIPESEHGMIFEKFRQLDASVTREHSGTGLGLPISKELVSLMGGSIDLVSAADKGATFTVLLPVECPEAAPRTYAPLT